VRKEHGIILPIADLGGSRPLHAERADAQAALLPL
jgi:hypothetical protein